MGKKEPKISLYVSCHKESYVPKMPLLKPIQVGAAVADKRLSNMLHDDEGENISDKNRQYCELTAQYWAWKNDKESDYFGFFHYRRYLSFSPVLLDEDCFGNVVIEDINEENLKLIGLDVNRIKREVEKYDLITSLPTDLANNGKTVYGHYKFCSPYHRIEDLEIALEVIEDIYPEYYEAAKEYINSSKAYFCNLYIMNKKTFYEYNNWIFSIIDEHRKRRNFDQYSIDESRIYGFLSERLFGIYYLYKKKDSAFKFKELQRTWFLDTCIHDEVFPFYKNKNIPIVLGADDKYIPYIATLIKSIEINSDNSYNYDFLIFNTNIKEESKTRLIEEFCDKKFINIRFLDVGRYFKKGNFFTYGHFSLENYYRLVIWDILKHYDKVIYLDSDLVVNGDIVELFKIDVENYYVAAAKDLDWLSWYLNDENRRERAKNELKDVDPYMYFNSGVMIFNIKKLFNEVDVNKVLELAASKEWLLVDQDVLNLVCRDNVKYLQDYWNVLIDYNDHFGLSRLEKARVIPKLQYENYLLARKDPKIVHYAGAQKPWKFFNCDMSKYFWKYARNTSYYESILLELKVSVYPTEEQIMRVQEPHIEPPVCIPSVPQTIISEPIDYNGVKIKGVDTPIYTDGWIVKFINKINNKYPIGSKKRNRLKKIAKLFLK